MDLKSFELKVTDLPKTLDIEISENSSSSDLEEMLENIQSQLIYNSRLSEDESPISVPKVRILERQDKAVKILVEAG